MSILKANILTFVNNALKTNGLFAGDDMDVEIQAILDDLSEEDLLEATDDDETLASGTESFSVPTGWRDYSAITLTNTAGVNLVPLEEIPGGINEYRRVRSNDSAIGTPRWYVVFNDTVLLWRNSNGVYTVKQEFTKNHPQDVSSIEFKDIFKNTINYGVAYEVSSRLNRVAGINLWLPRYEAAKRKRIEAKPMQPSIARGAIWEL